MGAIPPGKFIPIAEDAGLIGEIGLWVLRTACRQMKAWQAAGIDIDALRSIFRPGSSTIRG